MKTIQEAAAIIESHVSDWDPEVLRNAAEHAINGGPAHTFKGRPEDSVEFAAFAEAFEEIQSEV